MKSLHRVRVFAAWSSCHESDVATINSITAISSKCCDLHAK